MKRSILLLNEGGVSDYFGKIRMVGMIKSLLLEMNKTALRIGTELK